MGFRCCSILVHPTHFKICSCFFSSIIFHVYAVMQITGGVEAVRKALQSVSQQLLENPPRDYESLAANSAGLSSHSFGQVPPHNHSFASGSHDIAAPALIPKFHDGAIHGRMRPLQEMLTFRLLCPAERVGNIIGKGGAIIKALQQETACEIKVLEGNPDSEECVIVISGPAVWYKSHIFSFELLSWSHISFSLMLD